jgi:hypothetical protein
MSRFGFPELLVIFGVVGIVAVVALLFRVVRMIGRPRD